MTQALNGENGQHCQKDGYRFHLPPKRSPSPCPEHGIHFWLLGSARLLSFGALSDQEIFDQLNRLTRQARRRVHDAEINDAIARVRGTSSQGHQTPSLAQTPFDPELLAWVAAQLPGVDEAYLLARSPIDPRTVTADDFLRALFRPTEKVLIFSDELSQGQLLWNPQDPNAPKKLAQFARGETHGVWYLTAPVDGSYHFNPRQGLMSRRSLESVTGWRHLLLESDEAPRDQWLSYLCQIKTRTLAIYTSGGASVHALLLADEQIASKEHWDAAVRQSGLIQTLCRYGACRGSLTAVRLSRLPGCRREEAGVTQQLLYLNSKPEQLRFQLCRSSDEPPRFRSFHSHCICATQRSFGSH
jgi:hypothetical protein